MSSAPYASSLLLNDMEQAEKDLAMYAAIIGCRPKVSADAPKVKAELPLESLKESRTESRTESHAESLAEPSARPATLSLTESAHDEHLDSVEHPHRLQIWMRHVSHEAKKRLHEARTRLAG
jgi:hypothetical protein